MRPIDADEFKKLLLKERDAIPKLILDRYDFGVGRRNHDGDLIRAGIRKALRCMEQTPTIEAEPVKHGRWVSLTECANAGVYCSVCHKKVWKEDYAWCNRKNKLRSNFCPQCGARMDLEETT